MKRIVIYLMALIFIFVPAVSIAAEPEDEISMDIPEKWNMEFMYYVEPRQVTQYRHVVLLDHKEDSFSLKELYCLDPESKDSRSIRAENEKDVGQVYENSDKHFLLENISKLMQKDVEEYELIQADDGNFMVKVHAAVAVDSLRDNCHLNIYAMPVRENFWRVFIVKSMDAEGWPEYFELCEKVILSYHDTESFQHQVMNDLQEASRNMPMAVNRTATKGFLYVMLALIAFFCFFCSWRYKRKLQKDREKHPGKYREKQEISRRQKEITVVCGYCGKEYQTYVEPELEEFYKKNKKRCPECYRKLKGKQVEIARYEGFN